MKIEQTWSVGNDVAGRALNWDKLLDYLEGEIGLLLINLVIPNFNSLNIWSLIKFISTWLIELYWNVQQTVQKMTNRKWEYLFANLNKLSFFPSIPRIFAL